MADILIPTSVTLNLLHPNSGVVIYAKQYDKASRVIDVTLVAGSSTWDPPTSATAVIKFFKPDGTIGVYDRIEDNVTPAVSRLSAGKFRIYLAAQALSVPGTVLVDLSFYTSREVSTTFSFCVSVEKSVVTDAAIESSDYFNTLTDLIEGLLGATVNPPQIDDATGNWKLWNQTANRYEVSDYSSVGLTGPAAAITSTVYEYASSASGTTIPSTGWSTTIPVVNPGNWLWQRTTVIYDTGAHVILYNSSYQGQDGQGAPGSSTPRDLGTASAGSANAYSREDHVHKMPTPEDIGALSESDVLDLIYPVGSVYITFDKDFSPSASFGGNWSRIESKFIYGATESGTSGSTGGATSRTLVEANLPRITGTLDFIRGGSSGGSDVLKNTGGKFTNDVDGTSVTVTASTISHTHTSRRATLAFGQSSPTAISILPPYTTAFIWQRIS